MTDTPELSCHCRDL